MILGQRGSSFNSNFKRLHLFLLARAARRNSEVGFVGARSADKILNLIMLARTQRGENFEIDFVGARNAQNKIRYVGVRSAQKILKLILLARAAQNKN